MGKIGLLCVISFLLVPNLLAQTHFSKLESYYLGISSNLSGLQLKQELHNLIDDHIEVDYSNAWDVIKLADQDPANSNNVILVYTGRSQNKQENIDENTNPSLSRNDQWSREHVWAKLHGDFMLNPPAGTDIHNLKPCDNSVNNDRNQLEFDNGGSAHPEAVNCNYDLDSWEPRDEVKGDVARIIFYMAVRYEGDIGGVGDPDLEVIDNTNNANSTEPFHGKLSTLLSWHASDPPDAFEQNRNEVIFDYQGNRNPFIDHPEYVAKIWGVTGNIIINEFLADPASDLSGDANGDGVRDAEDDEFIEIFNNSSTDLNISGWTISDGGSTRHTFPPGTEFNSGSCIVVFGGGTPTGDFGGAQVQTASTGELSFNNSGDEIYIHDGLTLISSHTYGSEGNSDESVTRDPDIAGSFTRHSIASGSGGTLFSPGRKNDGSALPVEITAFTAKTLNEFVLLNWATATEVNNYGFEVEKAFSHAEDDRSNQNIEQSKWSKVGFVTGNGNSNSPKQYSFIDNEIGNGIYYYRLKQIDTDGNFEYYGPLKIEISSFIENQLIQNFPNPFNPSTTIEYRISNVGARHVSSVQIIVYDILGNQIVKLVDKKQNPGYYRIKFDANIYNLSSGIYYYELRTESQREIKKMLLIK